MKPEKTLIEAHNYLVYIADALYAVSQQFSIDRQDKVTLAKYADDLLSYSKAIEKIRNNISVKEQMKQKELEDELEDIQEK